MTVTSPSWLVFTRPGPPLRRGETGEQIVATACSPATGRVLSAVIVATLIGCAERAGTLCADSATSLPVGNENCCSSKKNLCRFAE